MLKLISSMSQMDPRQLMAVYRESNLKNAKRRYKECTDEMALAREEEDFLNYLREDFFRVKGTLYALWVADGVYKAALRVEPYRDGFLLEALETAPNARRKGYARALMDGIADHLRASGCRCIYSHIHKGNMPSLGVHNQCGFRVIADTAALLDGTVTGRYCTMCLYL